MKYNLQFFAEEDVSEEVVAPQTEDTDLSEETSYETPEEPEETPEIPEEKPEEKPVQSPEENAKYAAARREAEAREKAVRAEMARLDAQVAEQFGSYKNPITGEPVRSVQGYFDALNAQKQVQAQQQMQEAGLDPNLLNELIANNPVIKQAQQVLVSQQEQQFVNDVNEQMAQLHEMNPSINTPNDLLDMENYREFRGYIDRGLNLVEAYRLVNYGKISQQSIDAAKQAAINQAKSTSHLQATTSVSDDAGKEMVDIPADELVFWKECYPELTPKQLKEKYNQTI